MQDTIYIRDELVLEARSDGPCILLGREGEPGSVQVRLNEVRCLIEALCSMAGVVVGDDDR